MSAVAITSEIVINNTEEKKMHTDEYPIHQH
jgi:hypothetical protein